MNKEILTKDERSALKSMALYWDEVSRRENTSPLYAEVPIVCNRLGPKILWIIKAYLEQCDIEEI